MLYNNSGNGGPIFKILSPLLISENILYVYMTDKRVHLTCNMLLHYLVKFKNPKNVSGF